MGLAAVEVAYAETSSTRRFESADADLDGIEMEGRAGLGARPLRHITASGILAEDNKGRANWLSS
jgi:hypothetical protein